MIDHALKLARAGLAIFPLRPLGNVPLVTAWPERASTDLEQVRQWWERTGGANIGIATGKSDLLVVDLDNKGGRCGSDRWAKLIVGREVPVTRTATTAHGGFHIYFRGHRGLRNSANKLAQGIDTRADGGFVVAPGSVIDRVAYTWVDPWAPIAPLPDWLAEMLAGSTDLEPPVSAVQPRATTGGEGDQLTTDRATVYARAQLASRCQLIATTGEGQRNVRLFGAAKDAGRWVAEGVLGREEVAADLEAAARTCKLPRAETAKSISSGLTAGMAEPVTADSGWDPVGRQPSRISTPRSMGTRATTGETPAGEGGDDSMCDAGWTPPRPHTDMGNAERMIDRCGADMHHCAALGGWLVWDERRWRIDDIGEAERRAKATVRGIRDEADAITNDDDSKEAKERADQLRAWGRKSEAAGRLAAVLQVASTEPRIPIRTTDLDADPWLMCVTNGVVDLRTAELRPHVRGDLMSKLSPVAYDPDATAPRWGQFVDEIMGGDVEMASYLQRAVGYSLTGICREQCMFLLHGGGDNGKSTMISTLEKLCGDYSQATNSDVLMASRMPGKSGPTPEIAMLRGARFVPAMEVKEGRRMEEGLIKQLTGQDSITADAKYRDPITFVPEFKIWLACNHLPRIVLQDHGTWRRLQLIPFSQQFAEGDPRRDKDLQGKLIAELPGILAWAVEGCILWQQLCLAPPATITTATEGYRASQDVLANWIDDCCETTPDVAVATNNEDVWQSWRSWAERTGEQVGSQRRLALYLKERGFEQVRRTVNGQRSRAWIGLIVVDFGKDRPSRNRYLEVVHGDDGN